MGGSGGSSYPASSEKLDELRRKAREGLADQEREVQINGVLGDALARFNDRDVDTSRERLDAIVSALETVVVDVDRLMFGGSVAKHTYVDGLSDIDALVVVEDVDATPGDLVVSFADALKRSPRQAHVESIEPGNLAVTIKYSDGAEIQLLPAVERNGHTMIASIDGSAWRQIRPHKFAEKLTEVNQANGGSVVPTIKLAKALFSNLPAEQRLSGYHVEAIAVDAFSEYKGRRDRASMLRHLVKHAESAVLRPTSDMTGQSVYIDDHFGAAHSTDRRSVSQSIRGVLGKLENASVSEIESLLNG